MLSHKSCVWKCFEPAAVHGLAGGMATLALGPSSGGLTTGLWSYPERSTTDAAGPLDGRL